MDALKCNDIMCSICWCEKPNSQFIYESPQCRCTKKQDVCHSCYNDLVETLKYICPVCMMLFPSHCMDDVEKYFTIMCITPILNFFDWVIDFLRYLHRESDIYLFYQVKWLLNIIFALNMFPLVLPLLIESKLRGDGLVSFSGLCEGAKWGLINAYIDD